MILNACKRTFTKTISSRFLSRSANVSTANPNTKSTDEKENKVIEHRKTLDIEKIINLDNVRIVTKVQKKKPERPPLVKNFFVSVVDKDLLAYPQVIDMENYHPFLKTIEPIADYFENKVKYMAPEKDVSASDVSDLKRMKAFGSSVGELYGGLAHFKSESSIASEAEAVDPSTFLFINNHRLVAEAISDHGTVNQKDKYLPDLANGNLIGAVCFHELGNLEQQTGDNITAENVSLDDGWTLNGSKDFVFHSAHCNLLLVLAKVKSVELPDEETSESKESKIQAFLVNLSQPGITVTEAPQTIGCNSIRKTTINFSNVHVSNDDVLSLKSGDCDVIEKVLQSSRIHFAILTSIQYKEIFNYFIKYFIKNEFNSCKFRDMEMVRKGLGMAACRLYALESMIYLTTGLYDEYENPKIFMETAILKAYAQDCALTIASLAFDFMGDTSHEDHPINKYLKDALQLKTYGESNVNLKHYIGLDGTQFCRETFGSNMKEYNPHFLHKLTSTDPYRDLATDFELIEYLHPSFKDYTIALEHSIKRLQIGSEKLFTRYGEDALDHSLSIVRLGEVAVETYALFASLARASRSYCIGLRYSVYETVLASTLCHTTFQKTQDLLEEIRNKNEETDNKIAETVLQNKKYFIPSLSPGKVEKKQLS